ncbi:hypothetical protein [Natrinema sp. 74]|uniref:hypothetical protein n=1 Tax=Natrinema sp. 74 TaxID=3384159 RepID=UPI0038D4ADFC
MIGGIVRIRFDRCCSARGDEQNVAIPDTLLSLAGYIAYAVPVALAYALVARD